jgi:hypothetical protein
MLNSTLRMISPLLSHSKDSTQVDFYIPYGNGNEVFLFWGCIMLLGGLIMFLLYLIINDIITEKRNSK